MHTVTMRIAQIASGLTPIHPIRRRDPIFMTLALKALLKLCEGAIESSIIT